MKHKLIVQTPLFEKDFLVELYKTALTEIPHYEQVYGADGTRWHWYIDLKKPLLDPHFLKPIAKHFAYLAEKLGAEQVATMGYGAAGMVGSIVMASDVLSGAILRDKRKQYGNIDPIISNQVKDKVCIVDDLLNSGTNAMKTVMTLRTEKVEPIACLNVFEFANGKGRKRLEKEGIKVMSLVKLENNKDYLKNIPPLTKKSAD